MTRSLDMPKSMIVSAISAALLAVQLPAAAAQVDPILADQQLGRQRNLPPQSSSNVLAAQVLLDHSGHSPGVVDGTMGSNTVRAIKAFQGANGLNVDGKLSDTLIQKLRASYSGELLQRYTITAEDVAGPFVAVPADMEDQAKLKSLNYESAVEGLAEKFHMSEALLKALNVGADLNKPGSVIWVVVPGSGKLKEQVARIEVDKAGAALRAFAADGSLLATYPATIGSSTFPSPDGSMEVTAVAAAPTYHFDPEGREWGPDKKLTIAAGPNNPVGGTWIDLSKDGYGIHGTPEPRLIGKSSSHGCVRLTNWDAAQLAKAVNKGTKVEFI